MKLNAIGGVAAVLNRNNFIVTSSNYAQTRRKGLFLGGKGMITCNLDSLRQSLEQRRSVINVDLGRLSMHEVFCVIDAAAECFKNCLMAKTDTQQRNSS